MGTIIGCKICGKPIKRKDPNYEKTPIDYDNDCCRECNEEADKNE